MNRWEQLGQLFGYPQCCVQAFCSLDHIGAPGLGTRPLIGTGFVPCEACGQTKSAAELTEEINANRRYPVPFPTDIRDWEQINESLDRAGLGLDLRSDVADGGTTTEAHRECRSR